MTRCDWNDDDCPNDGRHPITVAGYTFTVCTPHGPEARDTQEAMAALGADLDKIAQQTREGRR